MKNLFQKGDFERYKVQTLSEAMKDVNILSHSYQRKKVTVFLSHKHDDLDDLKGVIGFLENHYDVKVYIDSQDATMPKNTSGETAERIKERIKHCEKFILLATNGAIESKWCNWELGYGDAQKFDSECIALLPIKDQGEEDSGYKGNEYMEIYPHIVYEYNAYAGKKYYLRYKKEGRCITVPLEEWLS